MRKKKKKNQTKKNTHSKSRVFKKPKQSLVFKENAKNHPERIYVQQENAGGSAGDVRVAGRDAAWPWLLVLGAMPAPRLGDKDLVGPARCPRSERPSVLGRLALAHAGVSGDTGSEQPSRRC